MEYIVFMEWVIEFDEDFSIWFDALEMKKNLNHYLQNLSPESRKNIDNRAAEILAEEMGLQELRKGLQYSQKTLAEKLHVAQGEISKIEHRTDMLVSTLREYVQQLGGSLEITVHFPDRQPIQITQFELDSPDQPDLATAEQANFQTIKKKKRLGVS